MLTTHLTSPVDVLYRLQRHGFVPSKIMPQQTDPELLTNAVGQYQVFHGLPITGLVDKPTLRHLGQQRICHQPDCMAMIMPSELPKWPSKSLSYAIEDATGFTGLSAPYVEDCFRRVFAEWAKVSKIAFHEAAHLDCADIQIKCQPVGGPKNGLLAFSEMADGSMRPKKTTYDSQESWVVNPQAYHITDFRIDLFRVACHEIGHVLGLPHLPVGNLMQPCYSGTVYTPQLGDIAEITNRYGV